MNFIISKLIIIDTFGHHFRRVLSTQQNFKCNSINCFSKFYYISAHRFSYLSFSKHFSQTILCNASISQRRNISNNVESNIEESHKLVTDLSSAEEVVNLTTFVVPSIVKQISEWKIVEFAQQLLLKIHETTGLPWWASIALTAFIARTTVTLPLTLSQIRTTAKLAVIRLEMNNIAKRLKMEANYMCTYYGWSEELAKQTYKKKIQKEWKDLIIRDNCHPAKCYVLILIQFPLWMSFSFATRNLCLMLPQQDLSSQLTYMEMTGGGFGWITNLVDFDHYMILPIIITLLNLTILEVHRLFRTSSEVKYEKWLRIFLRVLMLGVIPVSIYLPAAVNIYWISSSLYGLMQAFLINSTRLRRLFKIPVIETELKHPYQHFYNNVKVKLTNK